MCFKTLPIFGCSAAGAAAEVAGSAGGALPADEDPSPDMTGCHLNIPAMEKQHLLCRVTDKNHFVRCAGGAGGTHDAATSSEMEITFG